MASLQTRDVTTHRRTKMDEFFLLQFVWRLKGLRSATERMAPKKCQIENFGADEESGELPNAVQKQFMTSGWLSGWLAGEHKNRCLFTRSQLHLSTMSDARNVDWLNVTRKMVISKNAGPRALAIADTSHLWKQNVRERDEVVRCATNVRQNDIRDQFFVCFYRFYIVMSFEVAMRART